MQKLPEEQQPSEDEAGQKPTPISGPSCRSMLGLSRPAHSTGIGNFRTFASQSSLAGDCLHTGHLRKCLSFIPW